MTTPGERIKLYLAAQGKKTAVPEVEKTSNPSSVANPVRKPGDNAYLFSEVKGIVPLAPGKTVPKDWNDDSELPKIPIYSVSQLNSTEVGVLGADMMAKLRGKTASKDLLDSMLYLAISLKDPSDVTKPLMNPPADKYGYKTELTKPSVNQTGSRNDSSGEDGLTAGQRLSQRLASRRGEGDSSKIIQTATGEGSTQSASTADLDVRAAAYSWIAAYLMRLHNRQASKFCTSLDTMRSRFKGWYKGADDIIDQFSVDEVMADSIKRVMGRRDELISTWVMWIAYNENEVAKGKNQLGILAYLAGQVFQYTGMHAATQILALQQLTRAPMGVLLSKLNFNATSEAVNAFHKLLQEHELVKEHPGRKTYFRYARVWDSGYFAELQTKNCPVLVYLVAKTNKEVSRLSPTGARSDPTQIYAIKDMGSAIKEQLDGVADRLSKWLLSIEKVDETAGSVCVEN